MNQELFNNIIFISQGALTTIEYSIISVFFGLIIGLLVAIFKLSHNYILSYLAKFYVSIFRGTPLLIQLSIIYYSIPQLLGIKISAFFAGSLAFSLNSAAYIAEIIKAGILAIDKGQFEAAQVLYINKYYTYRYIIIPQALRNIFPALMNELISMLKESAIISFIGEYDLMRRAQLISAEQFTYFFPMITAATCYYIMVLIITFIGKKIEQKISYD